MTTHTRFRPLALAMSSALLFGFSTLAAAQEAPRGPAAAPAVTPRAQAVLDRMTTYLRSLQAFSISADSSRDEVLAEGYKLQHNEHSELTVQRPNKLRAELKPRTVDFVFHFRDRPAHDLGDVFVGQAVIEPKQ